MIQTDPDTQQKDVEDMETDGDSDALYAMDIICIAKSGSCEEPKCYDPVKPLGHCCDVCGALVTITDDSPNGFDLSLIETAAQMAVSSSGAAVQYYVGRVPYSRIQVVILSPDGDSASAYAVANAISDKLRKMMPGKHLSVGMAHSGVRSDTNLVGLTVGVLIGTLLAVLSFMLTIYYIYGVLPSSRWLSRRKNFTFARFQNTLAEATSVENLVIGANSDAGPAQRVARQPNESFHNPLYNPEAGPSTSHLQQAPSQSPDSANNEEGSRDEKSALDVKGSVENIERSYLSLVETPLVNLNEELPPVNDPFASVETNLVTEDFLNEGYDQLLQ